MGSAIPRKEGNLAVPNTARKEIGRYVPTNVIEQNFVITGTFFHRTQQPVHHMYVGYFVDVHFWLERPPSILKEIKIATVSPYLVQKRIQHATIWIQGTPSVKLKRLLPGKTVEIIARRIAPVTFGHIIIFINANYWKVVLLWGAQDISKDIKNAQV